MPTIFAKRLDITIDGHVHTPLCGHAMGSMARSVEEAIARGLAGIVFLEHLECGVDYFETTWLSAAAFEEFFREGHRLQDKYGDRIAIGLGVEVGFNPAAATAIEAFLRRHRWDRIGLSCHFMPIGGRHCNLVSRKPRNWAAADEIGLERVIEWYYRTLIEGMERIPADVVCHLDAVMRFHPRIGTVDQQGYIDEALAAIVRRGLALEANTSGILLRGEPFPGRAVLRRALDMGIPVWPGSDAHRPEDVGRFFAELAPL